LRRALHEAQPSQWQKKQKILFMKLFLILLLSVISLQSQAQVALNSVIEHFTNTKCGICANRNPGLNANLAMHPEMSHLSVHPSSPYSTCFLSMANTQANDTRTNLYDLYGGTPRIVINGVVIAGSVPYTSATLFDAAQNLTSPYDVQVQQQKYGTDSIRTRVVVKTVSTPTIVDALLFIGLVEDTIVGNGGNGEQEHYDVLRQTLTNAAGQAVVLSSVVGDSTVADFTVATNSVWDFDRIYSMAILQSQSSLAILQSGKTTTASTEIMMTTAATELNNHLDASVLPNPSSGLFEVRVDLPGTSQVAVFDLQGQFLFSVIFERQTQVNLSSYPVGTYLFQLINAGSFTTKQVIVR
jgi:Secretion system C-terminal sorting domain